MSRNIKSFCFRLPVKFALLCLCLSLLPGCIKPSAGQSDTLRIGVAVYDQEDTFISLVVQHLERAAREVEGDLGIKINLAMVDGRSNQTVQTDQVESFLSRDYDLIFVNIVDRTVAAMLIDKAQEAEIPMIFFNRQPVEEDVERWEHIYYVGAIGQQSGELQGELALEAWMGERTVDRNGDGVLQYVMLEGEPGHQDALLRTQYSIQTLTNAGVAVEKLANETANWSRAQALTRVSQWLEEFGREIEVIFANNDDMALGAIDACLEAGLEPEDFPLILGVDATPPALLAVQEGTLYGTVLNDAQGIAQAMMKLALALSRGENPEEAVDLEGGHYVWLPYQKVTLENGKDFLS